VVEAGLGAVGLIGLCRRRSRIGDGFSAGAIRALGIVVARSFQGLADVVEANVGYPAPVSMRRRPTLWLTGGSLDIAEAAKLALLRGGQ